MYPLITRKLADYLLFKEIVIRMERREHLKMDGLQEIVNIKASLNLGLSKNLPTAFPGTMPVPRPLVDNQFIPDPE